MPSFFRKSLSFAFCSTCLRCSCALSISTFLPARRAILRWRTSFGRALPFPVCARPSRLRSCPSCYRSCHTTLTGLLDAVIVDGDESAFLLESERTRSVLVAFRRTCRHERHDCYSDAKAKSGRPRITIGSTMFFFALFAAASRFLASIFLSSSGTCKRPGCHPPAEVKKGHLRKHNLLTAILLGLVRGRLAFLGLHLLFLLRCELAVLDPAPSVLQGITRPLSEALSSHSVGAVIHVQLLVFHERRQCLVLREGPLLPRTRLLLGLDDRDVCSLKQAVPSQSEPVRVCKHRGMNKLARSDRKRDKNVPESLSSSSVSGWTRLPDLQAPLMAVSMVEAQRPSGSRVYCDEETQKRGRH